MLEVISAERAETSGAGLGIADVSISNWRQSSGDQKRRASAANDKEIKAGNLAELQIDFGTVATGVWNVAKDIAVGAADEVVHHPLRVIKNGAIGFGIGAASTFVAPPVLAVVGIGALALGGYKIYQNFGGWVRDAKVVVNPDGHTEAEIKKAHEGMQAIGAGAVDIAAGIGGGVAGRYAATAASEAVSTALMRARGLNGVAKPWPLPPARPIPESFQLKDTTMSVSNSGRWAEFVQVNGVKGTDGGLGKDFGIAILDYANRWATLMEQRMAVAGKLTPEIISETAAAADKSYLSGSMTGLARGILYQTWKHGAQLEKLYPKVFAPTVLERVMNYFE
jgi:hypothetical protein